MMQAKNLRHIVSAFTLTISAAAVWFVPAARTAASDHIDSPLVAQDRGADITDLYASLDPNDNSKVVSIMGTQGFIVSGEHFGMGIFDPNIRYRFEIENTADAKPDGFLDVTYSSGVGRLTSQTATITLPNGQSFTAPTTDILRFALNVPNTGPGGGGNPDGGFTKMGGRRLRDDVVDMIFTVINNGVPITDHVDANEKPFRDVFPFVADPTQPLPPGQNPDDHTRQ